MSIRDLKNKKIRSINRTLHKDSSFVFSDSLNEAFKIDGKPYEGLT
jgi:hypothetical protein